MILLIGYRFVFLLLTFFCFNNSPAMELSEESFQVDEVASEVCVYKGYEKISASDWKKAEASGYLCPDVYHKPKKCIEQGDLKGFQAWFNDLPGDPLFLHRTDSNMRSLLHEAVRHKRFAMVKFLVDKKGFSVNGQDTWCQVPLIYLSHGSYQHPNETAAIATYLIQNGADVNSETGYARLSPLYLTVSAAYTHPLIIRLLLQAGANPMQACQLGITQYTPLEYHLADADHINKDIVKLLLAHGKDALVSRVQQSKDISLDRKAIVRQIWDAVTNSVMQKERLSGTRSSSVTSSTMMTQGANAHKKNCGKK